MVKHRRFRVHFTPPSVSRLNMIERFFRALAENGFVIGAFGGNYAGGSIFRGMQAAGAPASASGAWNSSTLCLNSCQDPDYRVCPTTAGCRELTSSGAQ